MEQIDLKKYFVGEGNKMGRPSFDSIKLLKIILFAFMEKGYASLRNIEKPCKTNIRFLWLLDGKPSPSFMTKIFHKTKQRSQQMRSLFVLGTFFTATILFLF